MSVLSRDTILKAIKEKQITVTPFNLSHLGPASYDLTLSDEFRELTVTGDVIPITDDVDYKQYSKAVKIPKGEAYILQPGKTVLGITEEVIALSPGFCGLLEGRSRFARMGLAIHITAGFMQPGINNKQVLEIFNASPNPLALYPGTHVCQFVFLKLEGKAIYTGRFANQSLE
ncbi:hypothetical protein C9374_011060 [Naegleria lovaniensis]|uniref:dCTP deaminase n=1 Tax=Naegleria lovaniensis TaxID=51637 RepID=A0AA88KDL0_NAELO|nr:uncharacterized protein C9374_011060 [Naegleria lovaniensis]KAG2374223.1 hypothetical protein C9374_011060 [Naegleria lovaniensis]